MFGSGAVAPVFECVLGGGGGIEYIVLIQKVIFRLEFIKISQLFYN